MTGSAAQAADTFISAKTDWFIGVHNSAGIRGYRCGNTHRNYSIANIAARKPVLPIARSRASTASPSSTSSARIPKARSNNFSRQSPVLPSRTSRQPSGSYRGSSYLKAGAGVCWAAHSCGCLESSNRNIEMKDRHRYSVVRRRSPDVTHENPRRISKWPESHSSRKAIRR